MERPLILKCVSELLSVQFFIPHYQRGYRWTKQQVYDLQNDLDSFVPKPIEGSAAEHTFYCLQPIVVKLCPEEVKIEHGLQGDWYEVIDGQQRLTTIYLINHYANERWTGAEKNPEPKLIYETRDRCLEFLSTLRINEATNQVNIDSSNIDFFHISSSYQNIHDWRLAYETEKTKTFDRNKFLSKFNENTKVIWYEVPPQENGRKLFERLNMGKIPLTSAELVKALFLSESSFSDLSPRDQQVKKLEIAKVWDDIEQKLSEVDERFWSFATNMKREDYPTKINLILEMIANCKDSEKDPLGTFLFFNGKQKEKRLEELWEEIEVYYHTLCEWYNDKDYYHLIGYLIAVDDRLSIKELIEQSVIMSKTSFRKHITDLIARTVAFDLGELRYDRHYKELRRVLLLYNVEAIRNSDGILEFYPFKQYKGRSWSLEHIHARNSEYFDRTKKESWLIWLDMHIRALEEQRDRNQQTDDVLKEVQLLNPQNLTWDGFAVLFEKINNLFTDDEDAMDRDSEGISNMALLSQDNNSALNNAVFDVKRRRIIELDMAGNFIPICTRRVFMKYYGNGQAASQFYFWTKEDRKAYEQNIRESLKTYLTLDNSLADEYKQPIKLAEPA